MMKTKDILFEWRNFINSTKKSKTLSEGGNAIAFIRGENGERSPVLWNGNLAQAAPIVFNEYVSRSKFVKDVKDIIKSIDNIHKKAFGEGLYKEETRDEILETAYTFMGSSEFLFAPANKISDEEYNKHKKKTGDIDLLVSEDKIPTLFQILNELRGRKLSPTITFVGHNKLTETEIRGEQINGIFEFKVPGYTFLFQIDFVFVPFDSEGRPYEEEKFLRGSSWEDITSGIKGIGHKLVLQSLGSEIVTIPWGSALLATDSSSPDKIRLKTKMPDISGIRLGTPGIDITFLQDTLGSIVDLNVASTSYLKSLLKKVSIEEINRFVESLDEKRISILNTILNKQGLGQNQTITLLVTFIVHSPTVEDFELDSYFDTFKSLMAFSMGNGLQVKYALEPYKVGQKDVYRYLKVSEREIKFRKAEDVFEAIFGNRATVEDVRDIASFLGILRIMNRYLSPEKKVAAYNGLFYHFYESTNFMSAHDIQDDLIPKQTIMEAFENRVPEVKNSRKYKNKEMILKDWIIRYEEKLKSNKEKKDSVQN